MSVLGPARTCVFLLSSIPTFLQRPYSVPLGIPNSVAAFCTAMPPLMASSAVLRSSWTREVRVRGHGDGVGCVHLTPGGRHGVEWLSKFYPLLPRNLVQSGARDLVHFAGFVCRDLLLPQCF